MISGREDCYSITYLLWVKSLILIENHLRSLVSIETVTPLQTTVM